MRYIIDRFEGKYAIVELDDKHMAQVEKIALPPGAKEGDIVVIDIDHDATQTRRSELRAKMDRLKNK